LETSTESHQIEALRRRIEAQQREHTEQIKRANAALAAAQDRSYWLERWQLDLNELMRRPGASEARAAVRGLRGIYRSLYNLRQRLKRQVKSVPLQIHEARRAVQSERALAVSIEQDQFAPAISQDRFARVISPDRPHSTPATDALYERLNDSARAEVEARLTPAEQQLWDGAGPRDRRRLTLAFGVHHQIAPLLEATGLRADRPPPAIHAMERGSESAGGSTYSADMIVEAALESGFDLEPGNTALDFGCSSGRVVRVLVAAYPELEWHGCDPLAEAIEWARVHLAPISFVQSPERPPLPYGDRTFDLVFAISIWSHFAESAALEWLGEMRRIVRPGGRLVLTSHGLHSIACASAQGTRPAGQLEAIRDALYRDGFWFTNEFGSEGDHGIRNPDWGTAFLSPEWLLTCTSGVWRVCAFHPGRVQDNQDLYVLEPA
jgi:SAM-dependent methyltransferase